MNKNPIQTENTRRNLKYAYCELISSGEKLTVDTLSTKAGYNRCTFYRYYSDLPQLQEEIEDELCDILRQNAERALEDGQLVAYIYSMAEMFSQSGDVFCTLLEHDPAFLNRLQRTMKPLILAQRDQPDVLMDDYVISFLSGAIAETLLCWYHKGKAIPIETVVGFLTNSLQHGVISDIDRSFCTPFAVCTPQK